MAKNIPDWFTNEIGKGLGTLYALSLEGCPAADIVDATKRIWTQDVWERMRHAEPTLTQDVPRIREAFHRLRTTCTRWPTPAHFLRELPPRPQPPRPIALPPGELPQEERARRIIEGRLRREACGYRITDGEAARP